jgi:endonuclease-3
LKRTPSDHREPWDWLLRTLDAALANEEAPIVTREAEKRHDPFRVLVATLISLRTTDPVTERASARLFAIADTPQAMAALDEATIAEAIRPANFHPTKARRIRALSERLVREFGGRVPADLDTLLTLDGVGRKTANLVLTEGFDLPGVCVDTHVHRILNRLGFVTTKDPLGTEMALRAGLPPEHWKPINTRLVAFGQRVCRPLSPHCSTCPLAVRCRRIGVGRTR